MNNKSLFAVVIILLVGILAVMGINSRTGNLNVTQPFDVTFDSERAGGEIDAPTSISVQNN